MAATCTFIMSVSFMLFLLFLLIVIRVIADSFTPPPNGGTVILTTSYHQDWERLKVASAIKTLVIMVLLGLVAFLAFKLYIDV